MTFLRRTLAWMALLVLGLAVGWEGQAAAQTFSRTLEGIRVARADAEETILLTFSAPYEGNPIEEHQPGGFRLRLSATGSNLSRNLFQIREPESLIQDYKVVQSQYASTVVVNLRDPQLNLEGQISFNRNSNALRVTLDPPLTTRPTAEDKVLSQAQQRIGGQSGEPRVSSQTPLGAPDQPLSGAEDDWLGMLTRMVLALVFVLTVLYGLVFLYNRYLSGRIGPRAGGLPIRQLGAHAIGPRQRIVVLDINGEVVACGVTPQQISYLTHLGRSRGRGTGAGAPAAANTPQPDTRPGAPVPPDVSARAEAARGEGPSSATEPRDPVHQFAETLREKVRSLKRIK